MGTYSNEIIEVDSAADFTAYVGSRPLIFNRADKRIYYYDAGKALYQPIIGDFSFWDLDLPPSDPNGFNDEFNGLALAGAWTQFGATDMNLSVENSELKIQQTHTSGTKVSGIYKALPAGDFDVVAKIASDCNSQGPNYQGITLFENALDETKALAICGIRSDTTSVLAHFQRFTNRTTGGAQLGTVVTAGAGVQARMSNCYIRLRRTGTDWILFYSYDGRFWHNASGTITAATLAFTPSHIGLTRCGQTPAATVSSRTWFDFIRIYTVLPSRIGGMRTV